MRGFVVSVVVLVVWGMSSGARSQPMYVLASPNPDSAGVFGQSLSSAGDVDADGSADVLVGSPGEENAYVFSGSDGGALQCFEAPPDGGWDRYSLGYMVSDVGDLNLDGNCDVMVGWYRLHYFPGDPPHSYWHATVFSGVDWDALFDWLMSGQSSGNGFGLVGAGSFDADGDGHEDVILGAPYYSAGAGIVGAAYVVSGSDGADVCTLLPPDFAVESGTGFGYSVSGIADLDGDGGDDVLVGARSDVDGGATGAGLVYVFRGMDGQVIRALISPGPEAEGWFGYAVARAGDVNGDGLEDAIVGAPNEDAEAPDAGRAYVFSGASGDLLRILQSPTPADSGHFGYAVTAVGDLNGDGLSDVLIGAPYEDGGAADAGRAYVFSGTGALLAILESPNPEPNGRFGYSLDGLGDTNGDGSADFAIGAPYEDGGAVDAGRVYVYSGGTVPVELAGFTAIAQNGQVLLTWSTLSETETLGFHVYRSLLEAQDYTRITAAIIPGAGTSSVRHDYSYTDTAVQPGTCFYKLADVDFGGTQTMHGPVSVTVLPATFSLLGAHPNPFSETTTLRINLPCNGHLNVTIHNMAGELVRKLADEEMGAGVHEIAWDGRGDAGKSVAPGTYTCRAEFENRMQTAKVVVTK